MKSCDNCLKKINEKCTGWATDKTNVCKSYISAEPITKINTEPITNGDYIRSMTDEELVNWLYVDSKFPFMTTKEEALKWLKNKKNKKREDM